MATDVDRNIEVAKAIYTQYPLARLRALLPTRVNSPTEYHHSALLELIEEREQELAAEVAAGASRRAWVAIGISAAALIVAALALWIRVQELRVSAHPTNTPSESAQLATTPPPQVSSAGHSAETSPAGSGTPVSDAPSKSNK